jgi:tRNA nucleotidyltransferase (CCA-adding enzyme)
MTTVSEALKSLLSRIQPTAGEMKTAQKHCATIKTRLETVFTVKSFFMAGSRETFIRGRSDIDVFAQITLDEISWGVPQQAQSLNAQGPGPSGPTSWSEVTTLNNGHVVT